ncbi:MAG: peptide-methionine (S)-S-oxide reductase MsrA [Panacagrimonas sp.]
MMRILVLVLMFAGGAAQAQTASSKAIFAGGCFWCTESDYEKLDGVLSAVSGFTGGHVIKPTYEQTGSGDTGHTEAVEITFDPARISYAKLVEYFWKHHDPFDGHGQFCDQGSQYRPGIFYLDDEQKKIAEASRDETQKLFKEKILTEITKATAFWPAEDYHQDYYKNNPLRYRYYRSGCGRDARVGEIWKNAGKE